MAMCIIYISHIPTNLKMLELVSMANSAWIIKVGCTTWRDATSRGLWMCERGMKPGIDAWRTAVLCRHEEPEELRFKKQWNNDDMGVVIKGLWWWMVVASRHDEDEKIGKRSYRFVVLSHKFHSSFPFLPHTAILITTPLSRYESIPVLSLTCLPFQSCASSMAIFRIACLQGKMTAYNRHLIFPSIITLPSVRIGVQVPMPAPLRSWIVLSA